MSPTLPPRRLATLFRDVGPRRRVTLDVPTALHGVFDGLVPTSNGTARASVTAAALDLALGSLLPPGNFAWPADDAPQAMRLTVQAGQDAWLVCSRAWRRACTVTDAAIDLAASATPADWLSRLEARLHDASGHDPGPYAAVAWWDGDLPADPLPPDPDLIDTRPPDWHDEGDPS